MRYKVNQGRPLPERENMELTLKQYADSLSISYEAARSSFALHKDIDLIEGTHYMKRGRQRILTAEGIALMNEYRQKPVAILPGDVATLEAKIKGLEDQIRELEDQIAARNAENAELRLQITGLEAKLTERNEALINAQFRLLEAQGRLLTAADQPEQKKGFFARLFGK